MTSTAAFSTIAVVGAGAWGTALAQLCAQNDVGTMLWARDACLAEVLGAQGENPKYLPGVALDARLAATSDLGDLARAEAVVYVAPAQAARGLFKRLQDVFDAPQPVLICAKGIETATGAMMTEVLAEAWPGAAPAVLSGPSFARDLAAGLPTAVTLAAADDALAGRWAASLGRPGFRLYRTDDVVGVELGGAAKNVLAIAAGAAEGAGLGASARAALIARGYAEMQRLGRALGARPETLGGLSGLGDLILTATSAQSRNYALGLALGGGVTTTDYLKEKTTVSEGVGTAAALVALGARHGVETPISTAVADLVAGARGLDRIVEDLLSRPAKREDEA